MCSETETKLKVILKYSVLNQKYYVKSNNTNNKNTDRQKENNLLGYQTH